MSTVVMFRSSSSDIIDFTDVVTRFIATLADTIVPTVKVRSFVNQKPWVDGSIRHALNTCTAAYNSSLVSRHMDEYKALSYGLQRAVKDTKRRYRDRVEMQMEQRDTRHIWQGLRTIRDYRGRTPSTVSAEASPVDDLNSFYAQFEASNNTVSGTIAEVNSIARGEHDVRRALMRKHQESCRF